MRFHISIFSDSTFSAVGDEFIKNCSITKGKVFKNVTSVRTTQYSWMVVISARNNLTMRSL